MRYLFILVLMGFLVGSENKQEWGYQKDTPPEEIEKYEEPYKEPIPPEVIELENLQKKCFEDPAPKLRKKRMKSAVEKARLEELDLRRGKYCWEVGMTYFDGKKTKQDYTKALEFFELGCKYKGGGSCYAAGYLYEFGKGTQSDTQKAKNLYQKACNYDYSDGCEAYRAIN